MYILNPSFFFRGNYTYFPLSCVFILCNFDILFFLILLLLFFGQNWRMSCEYDEEHFTSVSFPFYSIKSCREPHLKFLLVLNLCKSIYCICLPEVDFFKVNILFCCKLILSAFK